MMAIWCKSLLLLTAVVQLSLANYPVVPFQTNVASLFLTAQDPATAMLCFNSYMMNSSVINEKYSKDYNQCLVDANNEREKLGEEIKEKKTQIIERSQEVCERLNGCNNQNTSMETFKCHARMGALNSKDVYIISGNSSDYVSVIQEHYRIIDLRHEQCSKSAERTYVQATAENYGQLQDCLEGKVPPGKPPALTTTLSPPISTAPTLSTTEPSTITTDGETDPTASGTTSNDVSTTEVPISPRGPFHTGQFAKLLNLLK
uniref:DUF725 domain-containing protein n=1 Tax=Glossina brevipalpis TaxID=37001 RepID=A0A1A9X0G1_9MUSC